MVKVAPVYRPQILLLFILFRNKHCYTFSLTICNVNIKPTADSEVILWKITLLLAVKKYISINKYLQLIAFVNIF